MADVFIDFFVSLTTVEPQGEMRGACEIGVGCLIGVCLHSIFIFTSFG